MPIFQISHFPSTSFQLYNFPVFSLSNVQSSQVPTLIFLICTFPSSQLSNATNFKSNRTVITNEIILQKVSLVQKKLHPAIIPNSVYLIFKAHSTLLVFSMTRRAHVTWLYVNPFHSVSHGVNLQHAFPRFFTVEVARRNCLCLAIPNLSPFRSRYYLTSLPKRISDA